MKEASDKELISRYARAGDEGAFAELVRRHGDWVYSAARRQVGDEHLAEDVSQAVFLLLARKAGGLSRQRDLGGWLFRTLWYCVKAARKQRRRERRRELEAAMSRTEVASSEAQWEEIAPVLDAAVAGLGKKDREAVLLRFYERKGLAQIGEMLGVSEDAAQKRVERAVERLRKKLQGKGTAVGVGGLGFVMAERVTEASGRVTPSFILPQGGGDLAGVIAKGAGQMMAWAKVKIAAGVVLVALVISGAGLFAAAESSQPAATAPTSHPAETGAGQVSLVRSKMWVNREVAQTLKATGKPVKTKSQWFQAILVPTDTLHHALAELRPRGDQVNLGPLIVPDQPLPGYGARLYGASSNGSLALEASVQGQVQCRRQESALDLQLALPGLQAVRSLSPDRAIRLPAAMAFAGKVPEGMALVFVGALDEDYCLDIWEPVRMTDGQAKAMLGVEWSRWFSRTPGEWRDFADRVLTWQRGGKALAQSNCLTQRLGETQQVQLLGISRPGKWPGCWWTAAGQPIGNASGYPDAPGLIATLRVLDKPTEKEPGTETLLVWNSIGVPGPLRNGEQLVLKIPDESGRLSVEVAGAQWRRLGVLDRQKPLVAGATQVKLDAVEGSEGFCRVELRCANLPDEALRLVALGADGHAMQTVLYGTVQEANSTFKTKQGLIRMHGAHGLQSNTRVLLFFSNLQAMPVNFAVELSPYQQVRFEGLALTPVVAPRN